MSGKERGIEECDQGVKQARSGFLTQNWMTKSEVHEWGIVSLRFNNAAYDFGVKLEVLKLCHLFDDMMNTLPTKYFSQTTFEAIPNEKKASYIMGRPVFIIQDLSSEDEGSVLKNYDPALIRMALEIVAATRNFTAAKGERLMTRMPIDKRVNWAHYIQWRCGSDERLAAFANICNYLDNDILVDLSCLSIAAYGHSIEPEDLLACYSITDYGDQVRREPPPGSGIRPYAG